MPWYYQTAIGRIPIFLLGIVCHKSFDNYKVVLSVFSVVLIPVLWLCIKGILNTYMIIYCLAPSLILVIAYLLPIIKKQKYLSRAFEFLGEHSLEVYVANVIISVYTRSLVHGAISTLVYWSLHIFIVPLLCMLSKLIYRKI